MVSRRCGECGADFVWDSDVGSGICLTCGVLEDPNQSVLYASHVEQDQQGQNDPWQRAPTTASDNTRIQTSKGYHLPGQSAEVYLLKNKNAIHTLISAIATRLGISALVSRSQMLFDQAMASGQFRWGRKSRLIAGSAIAIAAREAHRPATAFDIAFLLDETSLNVTRTTSNIISLLGLQLPSDDPSRFLPLLPGHLKNVLTRDSSSLPPKLRQTLVNIDDAAVQRTAHLLCTLIDRANLFPNTPPFPTTCAAFMLALEGETFSSLPYAGELAKALGTRFSIGKDQILRRYKTISDVLEGLVDDVPWLRDTGTRQQKKGSKQKKAAVARGMKDIVQFQEEIWRSKLEKLRFNPDLSSQTDETQHCLSSGQRPPKRRKLDSRRTAAGSSFILSPSGFQSHDGKLPTTDLLSYLLSSDTTKLTRQPTRLQMLAHTKGIQNISDDDLFEDGEFDSYIRNEDEQAFLKQTCDWAGEEIPDNDVTGTALDPRRERAANSEAASRINLEALNRLLDSNDSSWELAVEGYDDSEEDGPDKEVRVDLAHLGNPTATEEITSWRPPSPGGTDWDTSDYFYGD